MTPEEGWWVGRGVRRAPPTTPLRLLDQERDHQQRDDVDDLDHRVDGGARRVFVRVADGVAGGVWPLSVQLVAGVLLIAYAIVRFRFS